MKTIKSFLFVVLLLCVVSLMFACDNNVDAVNLNPSIDPTLLSIRVGALQSDGKLYVRIPLEIYGTESDLEGGAVNIYKDGGLLVSNISALVFYQPSQSEVALYISGMQVDSKIGLLVTLADGSTLYYEGTVSGSEETKASLSIFPEPSLNSEVSDYFDTMSSLTGTAVGSEFSNLYDIEISYTYSSDCDAEFVYLTSFISDSISVDGIIDVLTNGETKASTIDIIQNDGNITWDDQNQNEEDYSGIVNEDGTFTIFSGDYVNEANYNYTLINGQIDGSSMTGTITRTIKLDGTQLVLDAKGSCTATGTIQFPKYIM